MRQHGSLGPTGWAMVSLVERCSARRRDEPSLMSRSPGAAWHLGAGVADLTVLFLVRDSAIAFWRTQFSGDAGNGWPQHPLARSAAPASFRRAASEAACVKDRCRAYCLPLYPRRQYACYNPNTQSTVALDWSRSSGLRRTLASELLMAPLGRTQHTPEAIATYCLPFTA